MGNGARAGSEVTATRELLSDGSLVTLHRVNVCLFHKHAHCTCSVLAKCEMKEEKLVQSMRGFTFCLHSFAP